MVFALFLNLSFSEFRDLCISGWMMGPQLQLRGLLTFMIVMIMVTIMIMLEMILMIVGPQLQRQ